MSVLSACTSPSYDTAQPVANGLLVSSVVDQVNSTLSSGDCVDAYGLIYPLYNSVNSTNSIRMAMASTYGCYATINFFKVLGDLTSFSGNLGGSGLWELLAQEFPSILVPDDKIPQAAEYGTDALMSTITPGTLVIPAYAINATSNNEGSLLSTDRTSDANAYLTFMSMALIGSLENRYGLPTSNYHKSTNLPWTTATGTPGNGCAFASALLNYFDGIKIVSTTASSSVASVYQKIETFLDLALTAACVQGCTTCGGTVSCTTCPVTLRSRDSCTGLVTDQNSCAAAGIITFVNASWSGPP